MKLRPSTLLALFACAAFGCGGPRTDRYPESAGDSTRAAVAIEVRPMSLEQVTLAVKEPGARLVVLNVWATWCIPCREEFPDLMRIHREYRDRGVRLMLVSADFDTELPAVRQFLAAQGVDFPTFIKNDQDMRFIDGLEPRWTGALPATFLYDGAGRKLWFHEGKVAYDTLNTRLKAALASAPVPVP